LACSGGYADIADALLKSGANIYMADTVRYCLPFSLSPKITRALCSLSCHRRRHV